MSYLAKKMHRLLLFRKNSNTKHLSGGHWITVTKEGPLHGRHLYISDNGTILAGKVPSKFHGKNLAELHYPHPDHPLHDKAKGMSMDELKEHHEVAEGKAKEILAHHIDIKEKTKNAPHMHMSTAHYVMGEKNNEELQDAIDLHQHEYKIHDKKGDHVAAEYHAKMADVAKHHLKQKIYGVSPREIPDEAPHTSKQPIHNTMSELSPSQLKLIIKEAKNNLKTGEGSSAYNKKKIAVATYYLNGGKKPDFEEKEKKDNVPEQETSKESGVGQEFIDNQHNAYKDMNLADLQTQKKNIEGLLAMGDDPETDPHLKAELDVIEHYLKGKQPEVPHPENGPWHNEFSKKTKDELEQIVADLKEKHKHYPKNSFNADINQDKIDIAEHYLKQGGAKASESKPFIPYPKNKDDHEHLSSLSKPELEQAIATFKDMLTHGKSDDMSTLSAGDADKFTQKLTIAQHYLKTAPEVSKNIPHPDMTQAHKALSGASMSELKVEYADAASDAHPDSVYSDNHKEKSKKIAEIAKYYIEQKGGTLDGTLGSLSPYSGPHQDKHLGYHQGYHDQSAKQLKEAEAQSFMQEKTGITQFDEAQKAKLAIIQHYLNEKGGNPAPHPDTSFHKDLVQMSMPQLEYAIQNMYQDLASGQFVPSMLLNIKKKIAIAEHYLKEMGGDPSKISEITSASDQVPHADKFNSVFHDGMKNATISDLLSLQNKAIEQIQLDHITPEQKETYKQKIQVIQHWMKQKGGNEHIKSIPDIHENTHTAMDDFNHPGHIVSTDAQHVGTNLSDHGIDAKDPSHAHKWQTPINHNALGFTSGQMKYQAQNLKNLIENGDPKTGETHGDSIKAKRKVQKNLSNVLKHNDDFLAFAKAIRDNNGYEDSITAHKHPQMDDPASREEHANAAVRTLVSRWAGTSGDSDPLAVAVQLAALEEFGLNGASNTFKTDVVGNANGYYLSDPKIKTGMKTFLREQYNQTQKYFKDLGITHVPIFRGMRFPSESTVAHLPKNKSAKGKMSLQPMSSFSANVSKAYEFAQSGMGTGGTGPHHVLIGAMIPVERILGCPQTGYGCMQEHEYVVIGASKGSDEFVSYRWHNQDTGSFSTSDMFDFMEQHGQGQTGIDVEPKKKKFSSTKTKKAGKTMHIQDAQGEFHEANEPKLIPKSHPIHQHGMDLFVSKGPQGYKVHDVETGKPIANAAQKTPKAAIDYADGYINWKGPLTVKDNLAQFVKVPDELKKNDVDDADDEEMILHIDEDLDNADWTKQSWDAHLPKPGESGFDELVQSHGGMEHFQTLPVYKHHVAKKRLEKSEDAEDKEYYPSHRYAYRTHTRDPIYIPVNRLRIIYQTDKALSEDKIKENVEKIKDGEAMSPVVIGYDHDVHDGHHRLEAAKRCGHTHVPCVVGGRNERRIEAAKKRYRSMWKNASGDPANLQIAYHATDHEDLKFVGDRKIKNYNQIGSWFTNDAQKAWEYYGPNVYEVQISVRNPYYAETDDFDKFFYNPDIAAKYLKLGADKSNVTREDMTTIMNNPEYVKEFKDDLMSRGHDAIVWTDSTIDIPPDDATGDRHTVTILLHPETQIKSQRLLTTDEVHGRINMKPGTILAESGKLLVKKTLPKAGERWVTIRGNHVLINGQGEIVQGPPHLKGIKLKPKSPKKTEGGTKVREREKWESNKKTPYDTKEIVEARANARNQLPTYKRDYFHSSERKKLREHIVNTLLNDKGAEEAKKGPHGKVLNNRRIDLVMGPPAAGKSTVFADPLARENGSLIIDSDMAKEMLPEFDGGKGAGVVHEESAIIVESFGGVFNRALNEGKNIVLPLVGKNSGKILQMRDDLKAMGYEIHVHLNDLPKEEAAKRAVARFYSTGRFVDPDYVYNDVGNRPADAYEQLKQAGGFHSYAKVSNNVKKGEKPIVIEKLQGDGAKGSGAGESGSRRNATGSSKRDAGASKEGTRSEKQKVSQSDPTDERLKQFAQKYKSAEEFESALANKRVGQKSPSELFAIMDSNSDGQLNSNKVKQALSEGGQHYFLTQVNPNNLNVQGQYHEQDSDKIKGVKDTFDQSKAPPIIVGSNNEVIDGRHRTLSAQKNGTQAIHAYVSAKDFYKLHVAKKSFVNKLGRLLIKKI